MSVDLKKELQTSIVKVLNSDSRPMSLNFLMHKVFDDLQERHDSMFVNQKEFSVALDELVKKYWVGRTRNSRYYLDYLDYPETGVVGEGYLEVDFLSGHGYITVKRNYREYKKPSYFVHKKNINGAKWGDYVKFAEIDHVRSRKFDFKDAIIKEVLPKPKAVYS